MSNVNDNRSYATDNGFYLGDTVVVGDLKGKQFQIAEIMSKGHWTWVNGMQVPCSIVKLSDGTTMLDIRLTRVK